MEISKLTNIQPASFNTQVNRSRVQTEHIVNLLKKGINEGRALTREDVIQCFIDVKFNGKDTFSRCEWDHWIKKDVHKTYTRETFRKQIYYPHALQWFKSNLGAAILSGKILAIPVIDI